MVDWIHARILNESYDDQRGEKVDARQIVAGWTHLVESIAIRDNSVEPCARNHRRKTPSEPVHKRKTNMPSPFPSSEEQAVIKTFSDSLGANLDKLVGSVVTHAVMQKFTIEQSENSELVALLKKDSPFVSALVLQNPEVRKFLISLLGEIMYDIACFHQKEVTDETRP